MDSARHSSTFPFPTLFLSILAVEGLLANITYLDCWHFVDFSFSFFFVYFFLAVFCFGTLRADLRFEGRETAREERKRGCRRGRKYYAPAIEDTRGSTLLEIRACENGWDATMTTSKGNTLLVE